MNDLERHVLVAFGGSEFDCSAGEFDLDVFVVHVLPGSGCEHERSVRAGAEGGKVTHGRSKARRGLESRLVRMVHILSKRLNCEPTS